MSDAKKCDICGEFYIVGEHKYRSAPNTIELSFRNAQYKSTLDRVTLDVCADCMKAFDKWRKGRRLNDA